MLRLSLYGDISGISSRTGVFRVESSQHCLHVQQASIAQLESQIVEAMLCLTCILWSSMLLVAEIAAVAVLFIIGITKTVWILCQQLHIA